MPKCHHCSELALRPSCNSRTGAEHFLGQPNLSIICQSPSLQTVSNALLMSMKVMQVVILLLALRLVGSEDRVKCPKATDSLEVGPVPGGLSGG